MQIEGYRDRVKAFYDMMIERELIRQRRRAGLDMSMWTSDPIFQTYSFTNVKRHHDRTTVLLKHELYEPNINEMEGFHQDGLTNDELMVVLLNCAIYRFFGTIESARMIGWTKVWPEGREKIMRIGPMLKFTAAYIVTSAGRSDPKYVVVCEFIDHLIDHLPKIIECSKWEDAIEEMTKVYGIGSFMAKEIYLDYILATGRVPMDWTTWTPVGPGGRRGASRIRYNVPDKISETEALEVIRDVYALRDEYWPKRIKTEYVWDMPELDLTDIQFQFCEFDKYSRVAEGRRPKRFFRPTADAVTQPKQCCRLDYNGDGNCTIHSMPGVLRVLQ